MSLTRSRIAQLSAVAFAAVAFAAAPIAAADPADLVPVCSGNQTPEDNNCRTPCPEGAPINSEGACAEPGAVGADDDLDTGAPGADPNVPLGPQ